MPAVDQVRVHVVDEDGDQSYSGLWVPDGTLITDPGPAAIAAAIQGVTSGRVYRTSLVAEAPYSGTPAVAGPYDSRDKIVLKFRDADGGRVSVSIPAPIEDTLEADDSTVDLADPLVAAVVTAVTTYARSKSGAAIVSAIRGYRTRRNV